MLIIKQILYLFSALFLIYSCNKGENFGPINKNQNTEIPQSFQNGVFIVNEGNYTWNNASIDFYSFAENKIYQNVFLAQNNYPLGDVAQSINIFDSKIYIVVNNSGKIEVLNSADLKKTATISNLISPRYIEFIDKNKAYITDLYANKISVLNLQNYTISKQIKVKSACEQMIKHQNKLFVTNMGGDKVYVVNTNKDELIDSILVGKEPNSIVLDKNNKIWVLCSGGYDGAEFPRLIKINPQNNNIELNILFPSKTNPFKLCTNQAKDKLYFINSSIFEMSIDDTNIPVNPVIKRKKELFYGVKVNLSTNNLFVSDAIDYQQKSTIYEYKFNGTNWVQINSFKAGMLSSDFLFAP